MANGKNVLLTVKSLSDTTRTVIYVSVGIGVIYILYKLYKMLKGLSFSEFKRKIKEGFKPTPLTEEQKRKISKASPSLVGGAWKEPSSLYQEYLERVKSGKVDTSMTLKEFWTEERKKEYLAKLSGKGKIRYQNTREQMKKRYSGIEEYWRRKMIEQTEKEIEEEMRWMPKKRLPVGGGSKSARKFIKMR